MRFHLFLMMNTSALLEEKKIIGIWLNYFNFFGVWQIEINPQIIMISLIINVFAISSPHLCALFLVKITKGHACFVYIFCLLFSHFYNIKIIVCLFLFVETERNRKRDRESVYVNNTFLKTNQDRKQTTTRVITIYKLQKS